MILKMRCRRCTPRGAVLGPRRSPAKPVPPREAAGVASSREYPRPRAAPLMAESLSLSACGLALLSLADCQAVLDGGRAGCPDPDSSPPSSRAPLARDGCRLPRCCICENARGLARLGEIPGARALGVARNTVNRRGGLQSYGIGARTGSVDASRALSYRGWSRNTSRNTEALVEPHHQHYNLALARRRAGCLSPNQQVPGHPALVGQRAEAAVRGRGVPVRERADSRQDFGSDAGMSSWGATYGRRHD